MHCGTCIAIGDSFDLTFWIFAVIFSPSVKRFSIIFTCAHRIFRLCFRDRTVFRLLEQCISPADSVLHAVQRREDLKQRLVSKSPLGEYIGTVFDFASGMTASMGMVQQLLGHLEGQGISAAATSCADLLALLAKYCPQVRGKGEWLPPRSRSSANVCEQLPDAYF